MEAVSRNNPRWRTSSASGGGECVEVAFADEGVLVRDSKSPEGALLSFTPREWEAFVIGVHRGEFDLDSNG